MIFEERELKFILPFELEIELVNFEFERIMKMLLLKYYLFKNFYVIKKFEFH